MKEHTYNYESIVVGNSIDALLCGYHYARPVLTLNPKEPFFFETFDPEVDLSFLGINNEARTIKVNNEKRTVGIEKYKVYRKLVIIMSLAGLLPLGGKAEALRQTEHNKARAILDHARAANFSFENLVIFGRNLLEPEIPPKEYMVLDWMNVRSGMIHSYDRIENESSFVNCIHFYPSDRIDGNHANKKDLVSVSRLTREQLYDYEFSDTYARFEILEKMKNAGIRGARNGRDTNNPSRYKFYAVKIESNHREVLPLPEKVNFKPKPTSDKYLKYLTEQV